MLWAKEQKKAKLFPCPCPEYAEWMFGPVVVADRFYGGRLDMAESLLRDTPEKYVMLLQYVRAENDAEPLQMEFAEQQAKLKAGTEADKR